MTVAGHPFDSSGFCSRCGRRLCDLLGYAEFAAVDDEGIACVGRLTPEELSTLKSARDAQLKVFAL